MASTFMGTPVLVAKGSVETNEVSGGTVMCVAVGIVIVVGFVSTLLLYWKHFKEADEQRRRVALLRSSSPQSSPVVSPRSTGDVSPFGSPTEQPPRPPPTSPLPPLPHQQHDARRRDSDALLFSGRDEWPAHETAEFPAALRHVGGTAGRTVNFSETAVSDSFPSHRHDRQPPPQPPQPPQQPPPWSLPSYHGNGPAVGVQGAPYSSAINYSREMGVLPPDAIDDLL